MISLFRKLQRSLGRPVALVFTGLVVTLMLAGCGVGKFSVHSGSTSSPVEVASAKLTLSSSTIAFSDTFKGGTTAPITVVITNAGDLAANVQSITASDDFKINVLSCQGALPGHGSCAFSIAFEPSASGYHSGVVTVDSDAGTLTASLEGTGKANVLAITGTSGPVTAGQQVTLSALLNGSPTTNVNWTILSSLASSTVGVIAADGLYSAPATIPTSSSVTIQAESKSDVTLSASLQFNLQPLPPVLVTSSPTALPVGTSSLVTLTGERLEEIGSLQVGGVAAQFTLLSSTALQVTVPVSAWASQPVMITAESSKEFGGSATSLQVPVSLPAVSYDAAVRFLQQAGFGATPALVTQVQQLGFAKWIDQELQTPAFNSNPVVGASNGQWYRNTQNGPLILRQRTSLALSEIFVTGGTSDCAPSDCGALWDRLLEADAFGNAKTLLKDVALSPIMGDFLNNGNNMAGTTGVTPNQNFGREFMQLMTIGTVQLNKDGTNVLDTNGNPIPTYDQSNISAMALALSGWTFNNSAGYFTFDSAQVPMIMNDSWHDLGSKAILPGITLPAGQTGSSDFDAVLMSLFNHRNIAPFLSKRLIQHFVTSEPSPEYVARISTIFEDDGSGTRGNLAAVVKAILLDIEARAGDDNSVQSATSGHFMEPIVYLSSVVNSLGGVFTDDQVRDDDAAIGQGLYTEPSVFSFYSPNHTLSDGTPAPEAQLLDNSHAVAKMALIYNFLHSNVGGFFINLNQSPFWNCASQAALLDSVNHLLFHGIMPAGMHDALMNYMATDPSKSTNDWLGDVLFLATSSSAYQVVR